MIQSTKFGLPSSHLSILCDAGLPALSVEIMFMKEKTIFFLATFTVNDLIQNVKTDSTQEPAPWRPKTQPYKFSD